MTVLNKKLWWWRQWQQLHWQAWPQQTPEKNYISYISFCHYFLLSVSSQLSHLYNTLFSSMLSLHLHLTARTAFSILFPGKPTTSDSICTVVFPTTVPRQWRQATSQEHYMYKEQCAPQSTAPVTTKQTVPNVKLLLFPNNPHHSFKTLQRGTRVCVCAHTCCVSLTVLMIILHQSQHGTQTNIWPLHNQSEQNTTKYK